MQNRNASASTRQNGYGRNSSSSNRRSYSNSSSNNSQSRSGGQFKRSFGGGRNRRSFSKKDDKIDVTKYIKKVDVKKPVEEYKPEHRFIDFNIHTNLKRNISSKGYVNPTPIQDKSINSILEGKDVIGIANTGTGKTAAFLIPLINKIINNPNERVLIIAPTRELAQQIREELFGFTAGMNIFSLQCIGGTSLNEQIYKLRGKSYHFIIGTPGRIKDLINRNVLKLEKYNNIVLDEVDRMVDMGFIDDIKFILGKLPEKRQSLFFSATISKEIDVLIRKFLINPVTISVKTQPTSENIDQDVVKVEKHEDKVEKLHDLLIKEDLTKVLIFVRTKIGADRLDNELYKRGFKVASIHGDKSQFQRQQSLQKFKENRVKILVATDVAARGLDIPNVSHVINYDVPATYEDYVHRIGRTGRAEKKGFALTFVS